MITQKKMLLMFDTKANNNKFYEVELHDNDEVKVSFGRVGAGAQHKTYFGGERKFQSLLKEKTKKGYREVEVEDTGGAIPLASCSSPQQNVIEIALRQINYLDDGAKALVERIAKANIHNIVSNSSVKYDAATGLFKTALGVVKEGVVREALVILEKAEKLLVDVDFNEMELFSLSTEYFSRIPNSVPNAREKRYLLFSQSVIDNQRNVCNSLLDTLELIAGLKEKALAEAQQAAVQEKPEEEKVFNVTIETLKDPVAYKKIEDYYHTSKSNSHSGRVKNSKVKNIYKLSIQDQQEQFSVKSMELGCVMELWHGTKTANMLSILAKGLLLPKDSPGSVSGYMYGKGLYFGLQSSKSAGYCDGGYWSGGSADTIYMFLASVSLGQYQIPKGSTGPNGRPDKGKHSFWAKGGQSGVINDEIIVFDLGQIRLDYILEISL